MYMGSDGLNSKRGQLTPYLLINIKTEVSNASYVLTTFPPSHEKLVEDGRQSYRRKLAELCRMISVDKMLTIGCVNPR